MQVKHNRRVFLPYKIILLRLPSSPPPLGTSELENLIWVYIASLNTREFGRI